MKKYLVLCIVLLSGCLEKQEVEVKGTDGKSLTVVQTEGGAMITDGFGGEAFVSDGTDGQKGDTGAAGATGPSGAIGPAGEKGASGANGRDGLDGKDGLNSLMKLSRGIVAACGGTGVVVSVGVDKSKDGVLDPSEITMSSYVCDGKVSVCEHEEKENEDEKEHSDRD